MNKTLKLFLSILFTSLFLLSIASFIIGILGLTTKNDFFYNGAEEEINLLSINKSDKKLNSYNQCVNYRQKYYNDDPRVRDLKCGGNTNVINGLLIAFGLLCSILSALLIRKNKLYDVFKILYVYKIFV